MYAEAALDPNQLHPIEQGGQPVNDLGRTGELPARLLDLGGKLGDRIESLRDPHSIEHDISGVGRHPPEPVDQYKLTDPGRPDEDRSGGVFPK